VVDVPEWVSRAKPVDGAVVEVGFLVSESFYFGPENDFSPDQWRTLREPLYQPATERHAGHVLSRALAGSTSELLRHYADVIRLRDKHGKRWVGQPTYFWVRPLIFSPGVFDISFPWYDTWEETKPLLAALEQTIESEIFSDLEQGWEVTIFASGGRLFIRQGDFDSGEEQECVSCDRAELVAQVRVRERCERILLELRAALGTDYWSRRRRRRAWSRYAETCARLPTAATAQVGEYADLWHLCYPARHVHATQKHDLSLVRPRRGGRRAVLCERLSGFVRRCGAPGAQRLPGG
jgi:hypothetical protein